MKIAIVLNRQTGQLDITWPNDEQHTYFVQSAVQPGDCVAMVEHELRDAVADTMQDLLKRGLVRIAGYAVPDGRAAEFAMRVQKDGPYATSGWDMFRRLPNTPGIGEPDHWNVKDRFVQQAAEALAQGNVVHLTRGGEHVQTYYPGQFTPQSRRRFFNEGAGDVAIGAGDLQLEGAGDLQLRARDDTPVAIEHKTTLGPPFHSWLVQYASGRVEEITDPCKARQIAESIYTV